MPNQFELDGRGPSTTTLVGTGIVFVLLCALAVTLLMAKSNGTLDRRLQVVAEMTSVGDGLPAKSDVKFRGVLVGVVRNVVPALDESPNIVQIDLRPEHARNIPDTVTARIVPSNAFAVSSVQLVDNGDGPPLRAGAVIGEDRTLPTQLFQTTLAKLRELVSAVGRPDTDRTLGLVHTIAEATAGKGPALTSAGQGLNRIVTEMNALSTDEYGPPTMQTWNSAISALNSTAPELVDALHNAVVPMRTVAEKQAALTNLLTGAQHTVGTVRTAMDNHAETLAAVTGNLTPVIGVLADRSAKFPAIMLGLNNVIDKFFAELWTRTGTKLGFTFKLVVALAPLRLYTRADCPVYGGLRGPSCDTAPLTTPVVDTRGLPDPRAYVAPPGTALPANPANPAEEILLGPVEPAPPAITFDPLPAEAPVGTP
ncbi:MlaD family protein [Mycolicibacterium sp. XJ870]